MTSKMATDQDRSHEKCHTQPAAMRDKHSAYVAPTEYPLGFENRLERIHRLSKLPHDHNPDIRLGEISPTPVAGCIKTPQATSSLRYLLRTATHHHTGPKAGVGWGVKLGPNQSSHSEPHRMTPSICHAGSDASGPKAHHAANRRMFHQIIGQRMAYMRVPSSRVTWLVTCSLKARQLSKWPSPHQSR